MKSHLEWDDLACFCLVARTGNLTHAARQAGSSAATLGRRMKALEARMGCRLFLHGASGYTLSTDGRALLARVEPMERAAAGVEQWRTAAPGPVRVRISAGTWTAHRLASHLGDFWRPDCDWMPEFLFCDRDMDIARREIDIGIRNRRPQQPWLAGRRTGTVRFAVFGRDAGVTGWIGSSDDAAATPSADWVRRMHGGAIVTTANDPRLSLAMAHAGIGRLVLPDFIGEDQSGLTQLSDSIPELDSERWIVCHHDARFDPPIRAALDALVRFLDTGAPADRTAPDAAPVSDPGC